MLNIDTNKPVLVTGATGYVAGWLVQRLLKEGFTVHAAVRNPDSPEKLKYLNALAEKLPGQIKYFKADLLDRGSYADAMQNCEVVFHTASPFALSVKDAQKDLVDPAKLGTSNVLEQATKTPSVKRVVVTSSCAAIYGDNTDLELTKNGMFTEEDWNSTASLTNKPYSYSKTEAEKEAWRIAESQNQWTLSTINPSFVLGPGINPYGKGESQSFIRQLGDGTMKTGAPRYCMGMVDVRDVAEAHFQAGFNPKAQGRYITSAHSTDFFEMAQTLVAKYGASYPIPKRALPKWLIWLVGPLVNKSLTRDMISKNVGHPFKVDNNKIKTELGISFRPLAESMQDAFQQMIDTKQF